jgi:DNA-binding SARP family transcriptional activator
LTPVIRAHWSGDDHGEPIMRYGILGPLWIENDLGLAKGREAGILAALLLSSNRPVLLDTLVDLLWPTSPPTTARQQVRNCAASLDRRLRRGGRDGLLRVTNGYLLELRPAELDALLFEQAMEEGRSAMSRGDPQHAADALRHGLDLWRGGVLGGLVLGPFQPQAVRLSELRLTAMEEYYDAVIAQGRGGEIVSDLRLAVHEHPLRQRFVGQLMRALADSGRQTEALDLFQTTRSRLIDEYGIDPGVDLDAVYLEILRGIAAHQVPGRWPGPTTAGPRHGPAEHDMAALVRATVTQLDLLRTGLESMLTQYLARTGSVG